MDSKIKKYLDKSGIKYEVLEHRKVYTAFTSAETQGLNTKEVVKTVLVKFDKAIAFLEEPDKKIEKFQLVLIAVPAGKRLDFKKINKFIFDTQAKLYKKLSKTSASWRTKLPKPLKVKSGMAREKDIETKLKTKNGLPSPLPVYGLPVFADKKLASSKALNISAGSYTESVSLKTKDYLKLAEPILGSFTE